MPTTQGLGVKLRLRPLRGKTYETKEYGPAVFIEQIFLHSKLYDKKDGKQFTVLTEELNLPIIDTKDYEKIPDEKYRGA